MQASTSAASDGYFQARASQLRHSMSRSHSRGSSPSSASKSRAAVAAARAPLSSSTRRPSPLRSSQYQQVAPLTRKALDWANDQMTTVSKEMENLLELKYRGDIQEYMYHMELKTMPSIELIDMQPEIQWFMRKYLMEFIIEVHQQHALRAETLYLAVNILDRYVSKRIVFKKHYQLVGCAAIWIAAKFEDAKDRVPTVNELVMACNNAYEESAFIQMEGHVLQTIGWILGHPTAEAWLRLAAIGNGIEDVRIQHTARFLMETTLFHRFYVACKPSDIAIAGLLLARHLHGKSYDAAYQTEAVEEIIHSIDYDMSINLASISPVLIKKYSYAFYSRASTFVRQIYDNGYSFTTGQRATPPRAQSIALSSPSASIMSSSSDSFSPAQSPCSSESSFDVSTPATPVTPMSTFSLSDHGSVGASKKGGLDMKTSAFPVIVQEDWSSEASMVHSQ